MLPPPRRRESFDEVAEIYSRARPDYPDDLVTDLIALTALSSSSRVLEIGAGTGQLSVGLAEYGVHLVALELGSNLAGLLQRRLERFDRVQVITADFDEWTPPAQPFDLVVAATAFHWLNPATRLRKCAAVLRRGGHLAIIETRWGGGTHDDQFRRNSQICYSRWAPGHGENHAETSRVTPRHYEELAESELFGFVIHRRHVYARTYSAAEYRELLLTFSDVQGLEERNRNGLVACISELIREQFGGRIERQDLYNLLVAEALAGRDG